MNSEQIQQILELHKKWLKGENGGEQANLSRADLSKADLTGAALSKANLFMANLSGTDLSRADLFKANLFMANLSGTNLSRTSLRHVNLSNADLRHANLFRANLSLADLTGADLSYADLSGANLSYTALLYARLPEGLIASRQIVPAEGRFTAFKKVSSDKGSVILQLEIPENASRVGGLIGRKCRAERAEVVAAFSENHKPLDVSGLKLYSEYNNNFIYEIGKTAVPDKWNGDPRIECAPGVHFFLTFEEAVAYE